jgi:hypothetical protein
VIKCVAYTCSNCEHILGVESDPTVREAQLIGITDHLEAINKFIAEEKRRRTVKVLVQASDAGAGGA